jgi:hypothetical protein
MSARERRIVERGQRVVVHMVAAAEDFPPESKGGILVTSIQETLDEIAALDVARVAGASKRHQGTAGRGRARADLRRLVTAVADTAETISVEHPDTKGIFSLLGKDRSDLTLIATANAFADAAAPFVPLFVEFGLPQTFISDLRAKADTLGTYMSLQVSGTGARRGSRETTEEKLQRLNGLIDRLDTVVSNKYRDNPDKLAAWEAARRVESAPHSHASGNNAPPTPKED